MSLNARAVFVLLGCAFWLFLNRFLTTGNCSLSTSFRFHCSKRLRALLLVTHVLFCRCTLTSTCHALLFLVLTMSHTAGVPIAHRRSQRLAVAADKARCLKNSSEPRVVRMAAHAPRGSATGQQPMCPSIVVKRAAGTPCGPTPDELQQQQQPKCRVVCQQLQMTGLTSLQQNSTSTTIVTTGSDHSTTMPSPPTADDWPAVEDWVIEYERRGHGNNSNAWRAWRSMQPAPPLVIPSFELHRAGMWCHGQDHVADHVAHHIGQWIVPSRYHISRQAMLNHQLEYVFDEGQMTTIHSVFVKAGVAPPSSVVLELLHHQDVEGDLVFSFECGRQLMYSFASALSMIRSH